MNDFRLERYDLCISTFNRVGIHVDYLSLNSLILRKLYVHMDDYGSACMDLNILSREEYRDVPIEAVSAKYNFENLEFCYNPFHASVAVQCDHLYDCQEAFSHGYMLLRELNHEVLMDEVTGIDDFNSDIFEHLESFHHPVQAAAAMNTVRVMNLLMTEFPDSASGIYLSRNNLLHIALNDTKNAIDTVEAKVSFLTTKFPNMLKQFNGWGVSPFLEHMKYPRMSLVRILIAADKEVVMCKGVDNNYDLSDDADENSHLDSPLHVLVKFMDSPELSPVSERADIFRLLINLYPGALSIRNYFDKYPYDYAVEKKLDPYFIRVLLRDKTINSALLYQLNYVERRLAMFLAFVAVSKNSKNIWALLLHHNLDTLKSVISFL
jgi:hypothetical protein